MPPRTQVNSATGIMGVTGSGKSALAATLAKYLWKYYRKILLYYNSDGGGFPAPVQEVQAAGMLRVFRMRTRDPGDLGLSFETCYRACQGWWPRTIDPRTGEVPPGVEMVPPIRTTFTMKCAQGHLINTVLSEALVKPTVCPQCKKVIQIQEMIVKKDQAPTPGFEMVGGVFFDGLSSMLAWELMELGHRAGRLELRGEEGAIGGKVTSGDLKFGGTTRSHVGFAQARGEELVHLSLGIPNLVVPPIFTMLTHEDVDDRQLAITGPKIAGRAKTDEAPQWFGNMLETAKVPAEQGSGEQRVLYLAEFTDPTGRRHLCKHRGSPGTMPAVLKDEPGGDDDPTKAFQQVNLGVFFELLNAALEQGITGILAEYPDAPGLPEGMVEIGQGTPTPRESEPAATITSGPPTLQAPGQTATPAVAAVHAPKPRMRAKGTAAAPPAAVPAIPAAPAPVPVQAELPVEPAQEAVQEPPAPVQTPPPPSVPVPLGPRAVAPPAAARPRLAPRPAGAPPTLVPPATPAVPTAGVAVPRPPAAAPRPPRATTPAPPAAAPPTDAVN